MLSYHNDPAIKAKFVNRMKAHMAADELIRGTGWGGGKGCAVGCTLNGYHHARYETELGCPEKEEVTMTTKDDGGPASCKCGMTAVSHDDH